MKHIANMRQLRFLHLIHVPITDAGLVSLYDMSWLESFYVDQTHVTDEGLSELKKALPNIHMHVNDNHLTNDDSGHEHPSRH